MERLLLRRKYEKVLHPHCFYYEVDPERLAVRIEKTNEVFEHLSMELPETIREEAGSIMREILVKLTIYKTPGPYKKALQHKSAIKIFYVSKKLLCFYF